MLATGGAAALAGSDVMNGTDAAVSSAPVEVHALVKRYGPNAALAGLDLTVSPGESVLLLGPNGAGKSTLLRLLAGLIRPTAGDLSIYGISPGGTAGAGVRRRLGLLSHQTFLYDHLTALENLEFYGRLYELDDPRGSARSSLAGVGLADRGSELVRGFSRGMQQRLAIARAMLHRPELLLLDEPFTGLDRDSAGRLQSTLATERRQGRTCIIATHDFAAGLAAAERIVVLAAGKLVLDRPKGNLDPAGLDRLFRQATVEAAPAAAIETP